MRLRVAQLTLAGLASGAGAYGLFGTVHSQTDKRPCCNNKYRIEADLLITGDLLHIQHTAQYNQRSTLYSMQHNTVQYGQALSLLLIALRRPGQHRPDY